MTSAQEPGADLHAPLPGAGAVSAEPVPATLERKPRRHWPRTILATVLILLGTLLTPAAAIGAWSKVVLTDTDAFVSTLAPLAEDPRVQDYLTDQATDAIEERLGVDALVQQGFALADRIPEVDRTIILIQPEWLGEAVVAYRATVLVGSWLPVVVVLLMAGGVLAAVHHRRAAVWAAVGLGVGALAVLIALSMGRTISALAVPPSLMPQDVLELSYNTLVQGLSDVMAAVLTLATVLAVALWLSGSSSVARRLRATGTGLQGGVHAWADHHGLSTGRLGVWLHRQRTWLRVVVAALAVGALLVVRPISVGDVLVVTAVWLGALTVLALCERPEPQGGTRT